MEWLENDDRVTTMAQLRRGVKLCLFLSSYLPLFAILAFQYRDAVTTIRGITVPYASAFFVALCVVSLPFLVLVIRVQSNSSSDFKEVEEYRQRNDQVTSYLIVYIFAFFGLNLFNINDLVAFIVFFGMVAVIQIRSSQLHVNPVLGFLGYDIYQVKIGREVALVVADSTLENEFVVPDDDNGRPDVNADERYLKVAELGNGVYITSNDINGH